MPNIVPEPDKNVPETAYEQLITGIIEEIPEEEGRYITKVGDHAFYDCSNLKSVYLPNAVSIGESAFASCSALTSVDLPKARDIKNGAFYSCTSLVSVNLPEVVFISGESFSYSTNLSSIILPKLISLDKTEFYGCKALTYIDIPKAVSLSLAFKGFNPTNLCTVNIGLASTDSDASSAPWGCTSSNVTFVFTDGKKYTYGTGLHD